MARKKAQHMYELLRQRAREAKEAAAAKPASAEVEAQETPAPVAARRRYIPAEQTPVSAPGAVGAGQERALEDVVTLRRDTLIVGILLVVVVIVVAFVLGRATAPVSIEEPGMRVRQTAKPEKEEPKKTSSREEKAGAAAGGEHGQRHTAGTEAEETTDQPAAQPEKEYAVFLLEYGSGSRHIAEEWRKFLVDEGFPTAEIKEKTGGGLVLRVPGYKSMKEAERAKKKIASLTRRGEQPFTGADAKEIKR
jgi:hypothetical protein